MLFPCDGLKKALHSETIIAHLRIKENRNGYFFMPFVPGAGAAV